MENRNNKNKPPKDLSNLEQNKKDNIDRYMRDDVKNIPSAMRKDALKSVEKNNLTEKEKIASGEYFWQKSYDKYGKESMSLVKRSQFQKSNKSEK